MKKLKIINSFLFLISSFFIIRCGLDVAGIVDDTENEIELIGYVLDDKNAGVEGVIARLDSIGAYDITDENGRYQVEVNKDTIQKMNLNLDFFTDSLIIMKDTSIVSGFEIKKNWIRKLPNIYIVQRNIGGKLITKDTGFKRIEAVIDIKNDTTDIPVITELFFFPINFKYSGYVFFINDTVGLEYNIYVKVYNSDSIFTGRSHVMTFSSSAGDIPIHDFNPYNAIPIPYAGDSLTVSVNDTFKLLGTAIDSFGGTIEKWEWDLGNTGNFISTTPDSNYIAIAPSIPTSNYPCVLKVKDNDGNLALDKVYINIILDPPTAIAKTSTPIVTINDNINLLGTASDGYGHIVKWKWDLGNTGNFISTTPDSNYIAKAPSTPITEYPCVLMAIDDDGNIALDTIFINVILDQPSATAKTSTPNVTINDNIILLGTAIDKGGYIEKWEWDVGNTGNFISTTPDSNYIAKAPSQPIREYPCVLMAIDDDGNSAFDTIFINVTLDPPSATAKTSTPTVSINDTIKLHGTANDNNGHIVKWKWDVGNTGNFVSTTPDSNYNTIASSQPTSEYPCVLMVIDDDGNSAFDTAFINVILDPPTVSVKTNTPIVSINDKINLYGTAFDKYGYIAKWEWDVGGNGTFIETTPDNNYSFNAPVAPNSDFQCILRVTDNDNIIALDTVTIEVLLDKPIPKASTTTPSVSINDSIQLLGSATNRFGKIIKWEWDVGNTGNFFETTPDSNYSIIAPSNENNEFKCILRVTDNDSLSALDTVIIDVLLDRPIPQASTTTPSVSINDSIELLGSATNLFGKIIKWEWDVGNSGNFFETTPDSNYSIIAPSNENSEFKCILRVTDNDSLSALDTVIIDVLLDRPIPKASTTTPSVSIKDSIQLLGSATNRFGKIIKWEWDVGNTGIFFETTPDSNYSIIAPSNENSEFKCILRVTDNDSISVLDTVSINVLLDRPIAKASTTTPFVSINDSIKLLGSAINRFGKIVKWEWDVGVTGNFIETSPDSNFTTVLPETKKFSYPCILRVTDDDGLTNIDSIEISILQKVTDIEGNIYSTVKIGTQIWTIENFRSTKYNDGTSIEYVELNDDWKSLTTGAYCYHGNDESNNEKYGALYNWYAVSLEKFAPPGWHVPTDNDWMVLTNYLIANGYNWDGSKEYNKIAKSLAAKTDWNTSTHEGGIGYDMSSNNRSGFTALGGSFRLRDGDFRNTINHHAYWWSSTEHNTSRAWAYRLWKDGDDLDKHYHYKKCGFSVRLVKD